MKITLGFWGYGGARSGSPQTQIHNIHLLRAYDRENKFKKASEGHQYTLCTASCVSGIMVTLFYRNLDGRTDADQRYSIEREIQITFSIIVKILLIIINIILTCE
uniref:Uncharacterized protein n=1 Tax=Amphimedon queenslandica TaxID=400682 RepID=A0A1X7VRH6_AMPQE